VTNASLLHLRDNYAKLVDSGANEIQISVDGASKETFEKIRAGSRFERIVTNCQLINDYCRGRGIRVTKMWTVVQRDNFHELLPLVDLSRHLGFESLVFSLNLTDWGQQNWRTMTRELTVDHLFNRELAERLIQRSRELGVSLGFWTITSKYSSERRDTLCPWPFERAYVSSDMRIVPCCMIANPQVADLGEARDFTAQWNSPEYQAFRRAHLEGRIPKICQACYEIWDTSLQGETRGTASAGAQSQVAERKTIG
jgi:pyrroloquinoline quinone biosynthesis protein E